MPYDWKAAAEKESRETEKLPAGQHRVTIAKVIHGSKDGPFVSQKGDRQILIVYTDREGREASSMYTLSEAAAWAIARVLDVSGANLQKMTERGITPEAFADEAFANANLVGRSLFIDVKYNDKGYPRITPIKPQASAVAPTSLPAPQPAKTARAPVAAAATTSFDPDADKDDNIPF